jgi:intraflagellar transport protein 88
VEKDEEMSISSKSKKSHTGTEAAIWEKELEINSLIEESSIQLTAGDLRRALELAKEAGKKERLYLSYIQSKSLVHDDAVHLTFATWFHLALVYERNEMYQEAIQAYTYLVKQKKFLAYTGVVRVQLGNILCNQRSYDDAIQMYQMAADIFSRDNQETSRKISAKIGHIYALQGKVVEAIHHYQNAARSPQDLTSTFNLLVCHSILGNREEVKKLFVKLVSSAIKGSMQSIYQRYHKNSSDIDTLIIKDPLEEYLDQKMQKMTSLLSSAAHIVLLSANDQAKVDDTFSWMQNQLKEHFPQIAAKIEMNHVHVHTHTHTHTYLPVVHSRKN